MIENTLQALIKEESAPYEIIVVDGGSIDQTRSICASYSSVYTSSPGRGGQMNEGARHAKGDILFFLHADTIVPKGALSAIRKAIQDGFMGGCFQQSIDRSGWIYRWIAFTGNLRAKLLHIFYGDQGIFVLQEKFNTLNGYCKNMLFEDVEFSRRLKKKGKLIVLNKKLLVSPRRWDHTGLLWNSFRNQFILFLFLIGVSTKNLKKLYPDIR